MWAKFEDYNPGRASQKALRTVPSVRSQGTVINSFWDRGLYIKCHFIDSLHNPDINTMWPLRRSRRNIIFKEVSCWCYKNVAPYGWAGIPADGEDWLMHNADTQCTVRGERMPKDRGDFLFKFFLSCHKVYI